MGYESNLTKEEFERQEEEFIDLFDKAVLGENDAEDSTDEEDTESSKKQESGGKEGRPDADTADEGDDTESDEESEEDSGETEEDEEEVEDSKSAEEGQSEEGAEEEIEDIDEEELLKDPKKLLQRYKTLQGMWRAEREKRKKEEPPQEKETVEEDIQQPQQQVQSPEEVINRIIKDEEEFVEKIMKEDDGFKEITEEFPDLAEALSKTIKKVVAQTTVRNIDRTINMLQNTVVPFIQQYQESLLQQHYEAIKSAHPDFEKYVESGELEAWIQQQPERKRKYYQEIYEYGTTDEVIDLIDEFKESLGLGSKPKPKPKSVKKQNKDTRKLDDMEDISSGARPVNMGATTAPKDDFELAFEEALKTS